MLHKLSGKLPRDQLLSVGSFMHGRLADFYLRANGNWSGTRTSLAKRLREEYPELSIRYEAAFEDLFLRSDIRAVESLAREMLAPYGGLVTELSHRLPVPGRKTVLPSSAVPSLPN
jgi:hypothetical protein